MLDSNLKKFSLVVTFTVFAFLLVVFLPDRDFPTAAGFNNNSQGASGYFWLNLEPVTGGLSSPTGVTNSGDGRLFVTERVGVIRVVENGQLLPVPFLDIQNQVGSVDNWEQGLLGLAFHPDYASNGFFFVNYTNLDGDTHLSRFQVSDNNPNLANPNSEVVVLFVDQPTIIHNGGGLAFGPDGYLYASLGDGGWLNDPNNQAQNKQLLLGKILRLDVSIEAAAPYYTIPADNPFVNDPSAADEIWALGFRNPWRITFDSQTGDLFIGDVGNFYQEEIDFEEAGDPGGNNYGWRCYEGNLPFIQAGCGPISQYTFPIHAYDQEPGCAVTGGYVYRGSQYPVMAGYYIFSDLCSGELWTLHQSQEGFWQPNWRGTRAANISSFGEGDDGEIYAVDYFDGTLYHLTAAEIQNIFFAPLTPYDPNVPTPTPLPPGPDLVVVDLTIAPISPVAGQEAEVIVTIQNQGNQPVQAGNNFFIDFYVDVVPIPYLPGVLYWGAQGVDFGVGESRSFRADFIFSAGTHNLYVQVDTDQSVPENNEQNNIFGPLTITVTP